LGGFPENQCNVDFTVWYMDGAGHRRRENFLSSVKSVFYANKMGSLSRKQSLKEADAVIESCNLI
jgi:hypothetical protein